MKHLSLYQVIPFAAFLSGATGVLYETLYPHILITLIGGSVYVITATLVTFLFSLAIGSLLAHKCIRILWLTEALLGVAAITIGAMFAFNVEMLLPLGAYIPATNLGRIASAGLLMMPVAFLVGISIPAFSALMERMSPIRQERLSIVYAVYNIGSALAILVSEYLLIRWLGIGQAMMIFGSCNLVVAVIAYVSINRMIATHEQERVTPTNRASQSFYRQPVIVGLFVLGIVSGAFQMETINIVNMSFGPTADVLSAVVALALLGIGVGSILAINTEIRLSSVGYTMALAIILPILVWPAALRANLEALANLHAFGGAGKLLLMGVLLGPFYVATGSSVPLAGKALWEHGQADTDNDYGRLLMVAALGNTAGLVLFVALISARLTDDLLIVGMAVLAWAAGCYIASGQSRRAGTTAKGKKTVATSVAISILVFGALQSAQALPWNGRLYSASQRVSVAHTTNYQKMNSRTSIFNVGMDNVLSLNGYVTLYMQRFGPEAYSEAMMAAVPTMVLGHHRRSLVIGAASGITASVSGALYQHTDLVDLDPNTINVLDYFSRVNHNVSKAPNVTLHIEDAVSWVVHANKPYDLIQIEPTSPASAGSNKLFSKEFLTAVKHKLTRQGVVSTWIGSVDGHKGIQTIYKTYASVFPYLAIYPVQEDYLILMGSKTPFNVYPHTLYRNIPVLMRNLFYPYVSIAGKVPEDSFDRSKPQLFQFINFYSLVANHLVLLQPSQPTNVSGLNTLNHPVLAFQAHASWRGVAGPSNEESEVIQAWLSRTLASGTPYKK